MESLFDSIIPLLLILFYLFGGLFRKKKKGDPPASEPSYPQPEDEPPSLREEIRRRFQERARRVQEEIEPSPIPSPTFDESAPELASEEQKTLVAQRKRLAELRNKVADIKRNRGFPAPTAKSKKASHSPNRARLKQRLSDPKAIGEAIVLMEILGTPVGLRKPHGQLRPH